MALSASPEPPCIRSPLLNELREDLVRIRGEVDESNFHIRGVWSTRYWLQLLPNSTPYDLNYLLVQTNQIGCCYLPREAHGIEAGDLLGASVFDPFEDPGLELAALDAAYGAFTGEGEIRVLTGNNYEKASTRAHLICAEIEKLLPLGDKENPRVGLVGVVGEILHELRGRPRLQIRATDFAPQVADSEMDGVRVHWGKETAEMVAAVDVALVTGMTLANGSLEEIVQVAREAHTKLVVFAETGHNFGPKLLSLGVNTVVAEDFPFYLTGPGPSRIRIERLA